MTLKHVSAEELYELLISDDVINSSGKIKLELNSVVSKIKGIDSVGHLFEEWVYSWAKSKGIEIIPNEKTQKFPDYYLNPNNRTEDLLEIKAFNYSNGASFDVADFFEYIEHLENMPYKLNAYYLVFAYNMNKDNGNIEIKGLWLKRIWELVGKSKKNHITCQIRTNNNVRRPYKIRPSSRFYRNNIFNNKVDFLIALQKLLNKNDLTKGKYENWFKKIRISYEKFYDTKLS